MKTIKLPQFFISLALSLVLTIWNPLGFDRQQAYLVASLLVTVVWWATEAVHKSLACVFLLASFLVFGQTPALDIFGFLWGDMNLLIMTTTLLSLAMMKTGLIHRYVEQWLKACAGHKLLLLVLPYLLGLGLIVLIPQAFARVIILGTILDGLLVARTDGEKAAKRVLMMNAFIGVSMAYMFFSNGDIVLNLSAITFAGEAIAQTLTFGTWFKLMSLPVLVTAGVTISLVAILFRRELSHFTPSMVASASAVQESMSAKQQKASLVIMLGIILAWATSGLHGIQPWLVAAVGLALLFALNILDKRDLSAVNGHFILFLMTIFSIGKVLGQSGVTAVVFDHLKTLIPATGSSWYLLVIILVVMLLHVAIGSSVATMSVVLPILLPLLQEAGYAGHLIVLMTYTIVNIHFLLPYHHAVMLMGIGKKYYADRDMLRYGLAMTVLTPLLILAVYLTWWGGVN